MKKLTKERRRWLIAHQNRIERRRKLPRRKKKIKKASQIDVLPVPEIMDFEKNYENVAIFLTQFREKALSFTKRRKKFSIDFEPITFISPGVALVLAAELDRWRKTHNINLKPWKPNKWHPRVKRLLNEMGLFSLLKIKKDKKLKNSEDYLRFFKFLTGNDSDGSIADRLMVQMSPTLGATYNEEKLYIAISEAMTNAVQHAYPDDIKFNYPILKKQWWLAGSFNQSSRMMIILFYDQGVSIPATLPKQPFYKDILSNLQKGKFSTTDEGALILSAIEIGKTRSQKAHRGKGLRQCLDFSLNSKQGNMKIISGRGKYEQLSGENATSYEYKTPLGGTFIEWRLMLS